MTPDRGSGAGPLPFLLDAGSRGGPVSEVIEKDRDGLRALLAEYGAVLFRGHEVGGPDGLHRAVRALSGDPLPYTERSSPRSTIKGRIYTSTDYPADQEIFLHNENSYQTSWPRTLYFHCVEPPTTLGATPLADVRKVLGAIHPDVREEFESRGWRFVRNFHEGIGVSWRDVFATDSRAAVERYCREHGIDLHWPESGAPRIEATRRAVHTHPVTGERVWFNHIAMYHHTTLPAEVLEGLLDLFPEEELPSTARFGDGGPIPAATMDHLRACYRAASTRFDWRRDDLLVVDNMLVAHGREPFTGPRRVAVAMAEPHRADDRKADG